METTLEGHHFVVLGWDSHKVMEDLKRADMNRGILTFKNDAKKMLIKAIIALGHFATTRRADVPRGRHYHNAVDFTSELESGSTFAVDVGRRYTVFACVSDVIYPPLSPPWEKKRRAPDDTVVKVTVIRVDAAPRGERAPPVSSGSRDIALPTAQFAGAHDPSLLTPQSSSHRWDADPRDARHHAPQWGNDSDHWRNDRQW